MSKPGDYDLILFCELYNILQTNLFLIKKKKEGKNEGGKKEFAYNFDLIIPLLGIFLRKL